ncbi:hypothetical protein AALB12_12230, partial [Blautia coccoides]|uniref:hypothetical protein n=1 Tax=Blautia producta TaxID=33035 RepID=UPI003518DD48
QMILLLNDYSILILYDTGPSHPPAPRLYPRLSEWPLPGYVYLSSVACFTVVISSGLKPYILDNTYSFLLFSIGMLLNKYLI